jgi:glyoxylate/hydroxypyruvate/2-ketogluconate reductase
LGPGLRRGDDDGAMKKVLITRGVFPEIVEALSQRFDVEHNADDRPWPPEELVRRLQGREGVMATVMDKFDEPVLAQCPELKVIANIAVGYNNIDVPAASRRGIKVTNTPGVLDDTTADLTWALLMAAARRIAEGDSYVRAGEWKIAFGVQYFLGQDIHHATLGIIGMGRIGQAIARRAGGFDMRVLYYNRSRLPEADEKRLNAKWVERDALLAESDFVVVMAPYSPATHHLIGAAEIARMKPTAILVNTARGGVVDDAALVQALRAGRIAGAGLDVFEGEPKVDPGYLGLKNVVMTPHIGSASRATRLVMCNTAAANMTAVLEGREPPNLVNR